MIQVLIFYAQMITNAYILCPNDHQCLYFVPKWSPMLIFCAQMITNAYILCPNDHRCLYFMPKWSAMLIFAQINQNSYFNDHQRSFFHSLILKWDWKIIFHLILIEWYLKIIFPLDGNKSKRLVFFFFFFFSRHHHLCLDNHIFSPLFFFLLNTWHEFVCFFPPLSLFL